MFKRKVESYQKESFSGLDNARQYAETAKKSMLRYRAFLKNLKYLGVEGKSLEIGAGPGVLTTEIARIHPAVEITAVDLSQDMATVGREYVAGNSLEDRINFVVGDAEDEAFINSLGKFDLVYCTYTLHHWDDAHKAITNLTHTIADGGILYLYDLRRVGWLYWVPIRNGFFNSIRAAYTPAEVEIMIERLGIEHFEIKNEFPFMQSIFIRK
jgi:2-polyprenyl-6-hydroxyphenyl methylase/3-demethylubiquinone-9 3-methyltransferase